MPYGIRTLINRSGLPYGLTTGKPNRMESHPSLQWVYKSPCERTAATPSHVLGWEVWSVIAMGIWRLSRHRSWGPAECFYFFHFDERWRRKRRGCLRSRKICRATREWRRRLAQARRGVIVLGMFDQRGWVLDIFVVSTIGSEFKRESCGFSYRSSVIIEHSVKRQRDGHPLILTRCWRSGAYTTITVGIKSNLDSIDQMKSDKIDVWPRVPRTTKVLIFCAMALSVQSWWERYT